MIQHKYAYFIWGLGIGYIIGSISLLTVLILLGIIYLAYSNRGTKLKFYLSNRNHLEKFFKLFNFKSKEKPTRILNFYIKTDAHADIKSYCNFKQESLHLFIEKAATFVFTKDRDWIAYQKSVKTTKPHPSKRVGIISSE